MMGAVVGVRIDGENTFHAAGVYQDYDTLCGIDANDPGIGHQGNVAVPSGQKITCVACATIWAGVVALKLKASDFVTP